MSTTPSRFTPARPIMVPGQTPRSGPTPPGILSRTGSAAGRLRTSHACDRCRIMRTKCSGGDRCVKCVKDNATCIYGDRKRERNKKDLAESMDRIDELKSDNFALISALRSVANSDDFNPARHGDVVELLAKFSGETSESSQATSSQSAPMGAGGEQHYMGQPRRPSEEATQMSGEKTVASSVGSPGRQGELSQVVDLDGGSGASGFIGKMSEISWIRRAFEVVGYSTRESKDLPELSMGVMDHHLTAAKDFTFYVDDVDILSVDEDLVDPFEWPADDTALLLAEAYFHAVQGTFPFVVRELFLPALLSFPRQQSIPTWAQRRWLAVANLVWAIGSKWLSLTKLDKHDSADAHLIYYARARALGIDHRVVFDHPDIERVQGIGILAFYLLVNGSITRAWNTLGHATRHATALGLHLRVSDPHLDEADRTRRARTWHSLYCLEILISEITGRPKSIFLPDVTTPLDLDPAADHEADAISQTDGYMSVASSRRVWLEFVRAGRHNAQSMTGGMVPWTSLPSLGRGSSPLYFPHRVTLCRLSDRIAAQLYRGTASDSWSQVQQKIGELQTDLRRWAESLPNELRLQSDSTEDADPRARIELAMYYHSVQMILHRPCLCEVRIENQSFASEEFNQSSARACVHAAMSLLAIIPDNPSAHEAYQLLPWWSLLHYVTQATATLLLEMALDCQHFRNEVSEVLNYLRKAMSYVWCMTQESASAYRAWVILRKLLSTIQERNDQFYAADIPENAPKPSNWTQAQETALSRTLFGPGTTDSL